jgi:hypothetical protein
MSILSLIPFRVVENDFKLNFIKEFDFVDMHQSLYWLFIVTAFIYMRMILCKVIERYHNILRDQGRLILVP